MLTFKRNCFSYSSGVALMYLRLVEMFCFLTSYYLKRMASSELASKCDYAKS